MGLDTDSGETSCEDFDSRKLSKILREDSDIDRVSEVQVLEGSDGGVPTVQILEDSDHGGTQKTHACTYEGCDKVFSRPWRLARHMCIHTGKRPFKCEVAGCEKAYSHLSYLHRHMRSTHSSELMYRQVFKCPHPGCLMELSNECNLKRHYKRKHTQKHPFICQYCDKGFSKHHQLRAHLYQHTGDPPFKCPTCGVGFTTQYDLKRHQRGHRTYACDCGQEFKNWTQLQTHAVLSHPAEFICDICKKSFKRKCRLRTHMSAHQDCSDREVLPCPYDNCPRFYYQKRNLTHHIKSSHEGKKYECTYPDCDWRLCTLQKLKEHMKLHDGMRSRPCKSSKPRKKRRDAGKVKQSMAVLLSGAVISREEEKALLNRSSDVFVITGNENSRAVRNDVEEGQIKTASLDTIDKDSDTAREAMQNSEA